MFDLFTSNNTRAYKNKFIPSTPVQYDNIGDVEVMPVTRQYLKIDWALVDWSKPVTQIAQELGCTVQNVYNHRYYLRKRGLAVPNTTRKRKNNCEVMEQPRQKRKYVRKQSNVSMELMAEVLRDTEVRELVLMLMDRVADIATELSKKS